MADYKTVSHRQHYHHEIDIIGDGHHRRVKSTGKCLICKEEHSETYPLRGYTLYNAGVNVQDALPDSSDDAREWLISGTCASCFDRLFGEEEEELSALEGEEDEQPF